MARVYANVNENMPRSYWDYDSVNISWGVLENYEVVRKIGPYPTPGKSGHFEASLTSARTWKVLGSIRGNQRCQLSEMCHQGIEAGQEEEDKA